MSWSDIRGYEGIYEINDKGEVKSLARVIDTLIGDTRTTKDRMIKPTTNKGKPFVVLYSKGVSKRHYIHNLLNEKEKESSSKR